MEYCFSTGKGSKPEQHLPLPLSPPSLSHTLSLWRCRIPGNGHHRAAGEHGFPDGGSYPKPEARNLGPETLNLKPATWNPKPWRARISRERFKSESRRLPSEILHPTPCTLHPTPYTLHPTSYTLHPTPHTPHHTPYTLHPAPYTLHPTPYTLHPTPYTLNLVRKPVSDHSALGSVSFQRKNRPLEPEAPPAYL